MAEITCIQNNIYGSFTFEATSGYKIKEITRQEVDELSPTTLYKAKETSEYLEVFTDLTCENYCIYTYKITSSSGTIYVFDNKQVEFEDIIDSMINLYISVEDELPVYSIVDCIGDSSLAKQATKYYRCMLQDISEFNAILEKINSDEALKQTLLQN